MLGDVFFRWVMSMRPLAVRFLGAVAAVLLGIAGMSWGAFASLAAIAAVAIVVIAVERGIDTPRLRELRRPR